MKLTFVGNTKDLSDKEINDILNNPDVNGISKAGLLAELRYRIKNKPKKNECPFKKESINNVWICNIRDFFLKECPFLDTNIINCGAYI